MQPKRFEILVHLALEPVSLRPPKSRRQDQADSLSMTGGFHRSSASRNPPLCPVRWAAGIMQSRHIPPSPRIGGLCLPLNSRKPGRMVPAAGETWTEAWGAGEGGDVKLGFLGLSFPCRRVGTRANSAAGLGPEGPTRLQISPRGSFTPARGRIVAPGVWSAGSLTQPHPGTPRHQAP